MNNSVNTSDNSSPGAIGALILIPVLIAGAAVIIAIKASGFWVVIVEAWHINSRGFKRKNKGRNRSDEETHTSKSYPDSLDLESIYPASETHPLRDRSPSKGTPAKGWHPSRPSRLMWSFGSDSALRSQSPCELSSVQKPSPCVAPPEKSQSQEEDPADRLMPLGHPQKVRRYL